MSNWRGLFPNGRMLFYEGNTPEAFVEEMKSKFGFDPSVDPKGSWTRSRMFFCPPEHLDAVYGNATYPLGS